MGELASRLGECFQAVFPELEPEEIPRASMASVASWTSLASINLISVIEEEFDIQIRPEELETMVSFELILDYLEDHGSDA